MDRGSRLPSCLSPDEGETGGTTILHRLGVGGQQNRWLPCKTVRGSEWLVKNKTKNCPQLGTKGASYNKTELQNF